MAIILGVPQWPRARAQSLPAAEFDVASVKPNKSAAAFPFGRIGLLPGGRFTASGATLLELTRAAYGLREDAQVSGGPRWVNLDRFDIQAVASADATVVQVQAMLKRLLADRFKLAVHSETKQRPRYALLVDRRDGQLGPQLRRSTAACAPMRLPPALGPAPPPPPAPPAGAPRPLVPRIPQRCGSMFLAGYISAREITMELFTIRLANIVNRAVVDLSHLTGTFDFDLAYSPEFPTPGPLPIPLDGASIFTALREQLGLRLESQRGPIDVLVIDHVDQPTAD
jgi:uncharacterized protein (TIGR03435 family)